MLGNGKKKKDLQLFLVPGNEYVWDPGDPAKTRVSRERPSCADCLTPREGITTCEGAGFG